MWPCFEQLKCGAAPAPSKELLSFGLIKMLCPAEVAELLPGHWQVHGWTHWSLGSFPTEMILWFSGNLEICNLFIFSPHSSGRHGRVTCWARCHLQVTLLSWAGRCWAAGELEPRDVIWKKKNFHAFYPWHNILPWELSWISSHTTKC